MEDFVQEVGIRLQGQLSAAYTVQDKCACHKTGHQPPPECGYTCDICSCELHRQQQQLKRYNILCISVCTVL